MKTIQIHSECEAKHARRNGSALMTVLVLMGVISIVSASLLTLGVNEGNLNGRRVMDIEGKHAVESAIEIAMARLETTFRETQTITSSAPSISLSAAEKNLIISGTKYVTDVQIVSVTNTLLRERVFVDETDPDTLLDPHRGAYVNVSEWDVEAEVSMSFRGTTRSIRAVQSFQARESPFFTHAIFYNMDLEFHPGPKMVINGPVHSNGTIWFLAMRELYFLDKVSGTKGVRVGTMSNVVNSDGVISQDDWSSNSAYNNQNGSNVWFNTDGVRPEFGQTKTMGGIRFGNLYDGYSNKLTSAAYFDSTSESSGKLYDRTGFSSLNEYLSNSFNGNLVTGSLDAPVIKPQFIPDYVAEDGSGIGRNSGYSLIEPLLGGTGSDGGKNALHKGDAEKEKLAYKAGLTFRVVYSPPDPETPDVANPPGYANAVRLVKKGGDRDEERDLTDYYLVPTRVKRSNAFDMESTDTSASPEFPVMDEYGNPVLNDDGEAVTESVMQTTPDAVFISEEVVDKIARIRMYEEDGNKPVSNGGLYDQRRGKALDLLELDVGKFDEEVVEANDDDGRFSSTFNPSTDYNGVVYVEFPTVTTSRPDNIVVAQDNIRRVKVSNRNEDAGLGLMLTNAKKLPNPSYNATKAPGFTIATNGTAYIHGNYNADGNMSTGSSIDADGEGSDYKTLAAIAADSITFLSEAFNFRKAKDSAGSRDAVSTEVNAALMAGIVPTNKPGVDYDGDGSVDEVRSGGSHNYPRFLEDWGGRTFRYRGSLVAFFESEVAVEPQEQDGVRYYNAPNREYGFYEEFGTGSQPPGTPMARTFFKLDFRFL
jgi:hypothetical protein